MYVLSLNRVVVFFNVVHVAYDVSFWVVLSSRFVPNDVVVFVVVFVLRVVHLDIPLVNLSNVVDRRRGWNRDDDGCTGGGFGRVVVVEVVVVVVVVVTVFISTIMQSVVVKRVGIHDIIPAKVVVWVGNIRKPHRGKVGVRVHEIVSHDFVCLIVVGNVFEELVLGRLQNNSTSICVKQTVDGLVRVTAFAEFFLNDMAIVKLTMGSDMNHEDGAMNSATIVLLHDERYFHLTGVRNGSGLVLRVID